MERKEKTENGNYKNEHSRAKRHTCGIKYSQGGHYSRLGMGKVRVSEHKWQSNRNYATEGKKIDRKR